MGRACLAGVPAVSLSHSAAIPLHCADILRCVVQISSRLSTISSCGHLHLQPSSAIVQLCPGFLAITSVPFPLPSEHIVGWVDGVASRCLRGTVSSLGPVPAQLARLSTDARPNSAVLKYGGDPEMWNARYRQHVYIYMVVICFSRRLGRLPWFHVSVSGDRAEIVCASPNLARSLSMAGCAKQ